MVATRRSTRVPPQDEGAGSPEPQTSEGVSPTSRTQTRRSARKDGQTGDNSTDESISGVTGKSSLKCETMKPSTQITTRSRHRSGQSDAEVSEAGSITSNASITRSRSRQSLGLLTDSTRKLRSQRSALITEPIIESKENSELSEAESNCSSVSTTARRRQPRTAPRTVSTRSRKSLLLSEPTSDVSDAESNSSSVSEVKIATRSMRKTRARNPSYKEQTSDAESCSSGFSRQPLARHSSRRNTPNVQPGEVEMFFESNEDDSQDQETMMKKSPKVKSHARSSVEGQNIFSSPRRSSRCQPTIQEDKDDLVSEVNNDAQDQKTFQKQSPKTCPVKSDAQSSVGEQIVLSSLRRSSRKQPSVVEDTAVIDSDNLHQSLDTINQILDVDQPEVDESSKIKVDLCVETGDVSPLQSNEAHPEENILPDLELRLSENSIDEEPAMEESHDMNDNNVTVEANKSSLDLQESENMAESMNMRLSIDSDESEKSEHSDGDQDDEEEYNMEQEEELKVVNVEKSQKASTQQPQDVVGDGLFVIDTGPGMDANKKYYMEDEDEEEEGEQEEVPEPDGGGDDDDVDDDDFIDQEEEDDEDEEETLLNRPKSGFVLSTSIDTGINIKKMGGLYINFDAEKPNPGSSLLSKMKKGNKETDKLLQKSVITPDFEKKECVPPYKESRFKLKKMRKEERDKTTGRGWFDMKAPELTDDVKNDLKALKMRSAMDSKHFYKKNDRDGFPKYFEVGTVVDNPIDFYHSRIPKKKRKRTIVEELLADSEFRRNNKKKYKEIIAEKAARAEGKKFRKKKKFRT